MTEGRILLGKIAFVDKGVYNAATTYKKLEYVITTDSTYLSIIDGNVGNPITDPLSWKCLADGKPSTVAAALCRTATENVINEMSSVEQYINDKIGDVDTILNTINGEVI